MRKANVASLLILLACGNPKQEETAPTVSPPENQIKKSAPIPSFAKEEMKGGYPDQSGEIIQKAILLRYNDSGEGDPDPEYSQIKLNGMEHVEINGTIICSGDDCSSQMILRIQPFFEGRPGEKRHESGGSIISRKVILGAGPYSILSPKLKTPVRMELHLDGNGDGKPTKGERFAVLERGGMMVPSKDLKGMTFDINNQIETGPMGGPANPDGPAPRP